MVKNENNVKRQLYDIYDIVFVLQKGTKGSDADKFISEAIKKLKDSRKIQDNHGACIYKVEFMMTGNHN